MTSVSSLFAFELRVRAGETGPFHAHACTEIIFYRGCSGRLLQGSQRHPYGDGMVAVYQPPEPHADRCRHPGRQLCIGIRGCGAEQLPSGIWTASGPCRDTARRISAALSEPGASQARYLDILGGLLALELNCQLAEHRPVPGPAEPHHVREARQIFDRHYREKICIHDLAGSLFIHPDYLRQLFRRHLGETPIHYLIRRRIEAAAETLSCSDAPVQEIARGVGIDNPFYFSRLFRRWMGCSPSDYRRRK